jgi:hypothetical protein
MPAVHGRRRYYRSLHYVNDEMIASSHKEENAMTNVIII